MTKIKTKRARKQIFVFRELRNQLINDYSNFCLTKYCIYDIIRRLQRYDTYTYEGNQKKISEWLGVSPATISYHINVMIKSKIIEKTDLGFKISDNNKIEEFYNKDKRGSFVIIDFYIRDNINSMFGYLTLEQFLILVFIFTTQITKYRARKISNISRLTLINKSTVKNSIKKLQELNIINSDWKIDNKVVFDCFENLDNQILDKANINDDSIYEPYNSRLFNSVRDKIKKEKRKRNLRNNF